jgi:hypothetical protein
MHCKPVCAGFGAMGLKFCGRFNCPVELTVAAQQIQVVMPFAPGAAESIGGFSSRSCWWQTPRWSDSSCQFRKSTLFYRRFAAVVGSIMFPLFLACRWQILTVDRSWWLNQPQQCSKRCYFVEGHASKPLQRKGSFDTSCIIDGYRISALLDTLVL